MAKKKKKKQKQKKQKAYRILIVEDDLTLLETLEYNLVESGYKVQTVMPLWRRCWTYRLFW